MITSVAQKVVMIDCIKLVQLRVTEKSHFQSLRYQKSFVLMKRQFLPFEEKSSLKHIDNIVWAHIGLQMFIIFCMNFKSIAVKHFNHSKVSTYKFNEIRDDITKSVLIINSNLQLIGYKKLFGFWQFDILDIY